MAIAALLVLLAGSAQLRQLLPSSVQRYMNERELIQRLSPRNAANDLMRAHSIFVAPHQVNGVQVIDAFIEFDNEAVLDQARAMGVSVNSVFDGFATAQIPVQMLETVSRLPGVIDVEISKRVDFCTDSTLQATHAWQVLNGTQYGLPQGYDGTGVIIGVIDSGFDYKHLAFRRADDNSRTRIVRVYDINDSLSVHRAIIANRELPGGVYMGDEINSLYRDGTGTHGTLTASVAAGLHVNGYGGMAPGADIVLCVCPNLDQYVGEVDVVNCIQYITAYADSVGKPCVINLSISTLNGPHDGTDKISRAAAQKTGPGRIIVVAAGNNGVSCQYTCGPSTMQKPFSMLLGNVNPSINDDDDKSYYYRSTFHDIWMRKAGVRPLVAFHVYDKQTHRIVWESEMISSQARIDWRAIKDYYEPDRSLDTAGYMYAMISQNIYGKFEASCHVVNLKSKSYTVSSSGVYSSRYQIGLSMYPPKLVYPRQPDSCFVDVWTCIGNSVTPPSYVNVDVVNENGDTVTQAIQGYYSTPINSSTIGTYAVHDSVISVGAYIGRNSYYSLSQNKLVNTPYTTIGDITWFSSYQTPGFGPTGKHLPTVCAPGYYVVSAASRYSYYSGNSNSTTVMKTADGSIWGASSGTSVAAPAVSGIIAQWLQLKPDLTPGEVKEIIANTAIKDAYSSGTTYWVRFGPNGKIDALAGIKYLLERMPVQSIAGDVNGSGNVDVDDLSLLIFHILGKTSSEIDLVASDVNHDGNIDVDDLALIINIVLGKS